MRSHRLRRITLLLFFTIASAPAFVNGHIYQWIRIGAFQYRVTDSGHNSDTTPGRSSLEYYGSSNGQTWRFWGMRYAALDTEDAFPPFVPDEGAEYMFAGSTYRDANEEIDQWSVGDTNTLVNTFTSYWRQRPPTITVNGVQLSSPFPDPGLDQQVAPHMIPGTADVLVVSTARNRMGLEIHHRVLSWSRADYDDFHIWEYDIVNTGNTDRDDSVEVNTTLEGLYLHRAPLLTKHLWTEWYGMCVDDTLRIWYQYPGSSASTYPSDMGYAFGWFTPPDASYLGASEFIGELTLFAESIALDNTDEWAQPVVHTTTDPDIYYVKAYAFYDSMLDTSFTWEEFYALIAHGVTDPNTGISPSTYNGSAGSLVMMQDNPQFTLRSDAGPYHETSPAWREDMQYVNDTNWPTAILAILIPRTSYGPYNLAPGDTITLVTAWVAGGISEQVARKYSEIHAAGNNGTGAGLEADESLDWDSMPDPPINIRRPEMYTPAGEAPDENVRRKDKLIYSGRDSLLMHAAAAKYTYENHYNIPVPPPAPDIEVTPLATGIRIEWDGWQSETATDFAGYRVYRARGSVDSAWMLIKDVPGSGTYEYLDTDVIHGQSYFYYVAAYDDGSEHYGDYFDPPGTSLESGRFLNQTTLAVEGRYPPGSDLSGIRVVPNPFNVKYPLSNIIYNGSPNQKKVDFVNLPPICTLKIYTESGDLVKTIKHTDGTGIEPWGMLPDERMASDEGLRVVSGVYILYVETPAGESTFVKFLIVR